MFVSSVIVDDRAKWSGWMLVPSSNGGCSCSCRLLIVQFDTTAVVELLFKANPLYIAYSQSDVINMWGDDERIVACCPWPFCRGKKWGCLVQGGCLDCWGSLTFHTCLIQWGYLISGGLCLSLCCFILSMKLPHSVGQGVGFFILIHNEDASSLHFVRLFKSLRLLY